MIPVILAGGQGLRLWPLSNDTQTKPFYRFFQKSFLEMSMERLSHFPSPLIVASESMKTQTEQIAKKVSAKTLYEPEAKNTAPAIALACLFLKNQKQGQEVVGIFPVDHYFHPIEKFHKLISLGEQLVSSENKIITLGLLPNKPLPGYGYIKTKKLKRQENDICIWQSDSFVEKPDTHKAQELIKDKHYLWNSGIFISSVDTLIEHFKEHLPKLWSIIESIPNNMENIHHFYKDIEAISFDKGIMENISEYIVLSSDLQWKDLGSWDDIADLHEEKNIKLSANPSVASKDSHGNFIFSQEKKPVGLIGLKDSLVVNAEQGLLIAKRGKAQEIKELIGSLKRLETGAEHENSIVLKPWGRYKTLYFSLPFKVKLLYIKPGERLSYQSHKNRREHWIVISGSGELTLNGKIKNLKTDDHILIPQGQKHRLKNIGAKELIVLETQLGTLCVEEDIIRYEDDYNR